MQVSPDAEDFPLTPRVERTVGDQVFSTLYDLGASVRTQDEGGIIRFDVDGALCTAAGSREGGRIATSYRIAKESLEISVSAPVGSRLVLPLIALRTERVQQPSAESVTIAKQGGVVRVEASGPLQLRDGGQSRVFNLVPGFLAVPLTVQIEDPRPVVCTLRVG